MTHQTEQRKVRFLTWALVLSPVLLLFGFITLAAHVRLALGHWPAPMTENYHTAAYRQHEQVFAWFAMFTVYAAIPLWLAALCFRLFRISRKTHLIQAGAYVAGWLLIALYGCVDPGRFWNGFSIEVRRHGGMNTFQIALIAAGTTGVILYNVFLMHANRMLSERGYQNSILEKVKVFSRLAEAIATEVISEQRLVLIELRRKLKTCLVVAIASFGVLGLTMRISLLLLLSGCCLVTSCSTPRPPRDANAELCREAFSPSWGGATQKGFTYHGRRLFVVIRCHTSGVTTSEPFILVQTESGWRCLFHATTVRFEMEASIEGDRLVLWRLEWPDGKRQRSEFMSYDLRTLDAD